jgi:hypothetical protein
LGVLRSALGGSLIATQRTTSNKRDRERAKQARAAAKRERRAERAATSDPTEIAVDDGATLDALTQRLKTVHDAYDNGAITFDDFDSERRLLSDRIAVRLADSE